MNFDNLVAVLAVALASIRDIVAVGLLQATSLPFIVAATTIGLQLHVIRPVNAAALVAAGLFSVILFPVISLQLLRSSTQDPINENRPRSSDPIQGCPSQKMLDLAL